MTSRRPSRRLSARPALAGLLLALSSLEAGAHDTWLRADMGTVPPGATLSFELASGMAFPTPETVIAPDRVTRSGVRLRGIATPFAEIVPGKRSLRLSAAPDTQGIATAWAELAPRTLDLSPGQVEEYLAEIGATDTVGPLWRARKEPRRWRETYRKHAKSIVRVGDATSDVSWREPVGLLLEILPVSDPTSLMPGDRLAVRVLRGGSPCGGLPVAAVSAGPGRTLRITDAEGLVSFVLDREGAWLLAATELRARPDGDWESDFTTITFVVGTVDQR